MLLHRNDVISSPLIYVSDDANTAQTHFTYKNIVFGAEPKTGKNTPVEVEKTNENTKLDPKINTRTEKRYKKKASLAKKIYI
jgi:hypothetical protein